MSFYTPAPFAIIVDLMRVERQSRETEETHGGLCYVASVKTGGKRDGGRLRSESEWVRGRDGGAENPVSKLGAMS